MGNIPQRRPRELWVFVLVKNTLVNQQIQKRAVGALSLLCAQGGNLFDKSFLVVARKARLPLLVVSLASETYSGLSRPDASKAVYLLPGCKLKN